MTASEFWGRRARNMEEMAQISARTSDTKQTLASISAYQPQPTDVIISPAGKCGTTLLQQTFNTLRTRGDMDFDDISRVVPWIETAKSLGIEINAPQVAKPRGFKSHLSWNHVPKGAKYIVSLRNPQDAFVSAYRFMEGWFFEPGTISYEEFFERNKSSREKGLDHWTHLVSWWDQRNNADVLLLSYEHMVENPALMIRRVARFCDIALDDELLALTLEHTSRPFMLAHKDRFDDALMRENSERLGGLPPGSDSAKVRATGTQHRREELPESIRQQFEDIWQTDILPPTGFSDYAALETELRTLPGN
ncbi:MAG: sulfotransferase domain-containing protein [Pseudomonadaceae bacterium]|nr:sulfotransferase domain-containing protein [Pseudomonadaceae bacterium]